ncbi:MAG: hypothetical protein NTX88_06515 [Candidatus Atribacteria bacterium]|nr:hypothetical protein [Candidatus Atribacteria bacterium]
MNKEVTFHDIIEMVDALPESEKEELIDILRKRCIVERRNKLKKDIQKVRKEFNETKTRTGSVTDIMKEIRSCED